MLTLVYRQGTGRFRSVLGRLQMRYSSTIAASLTRWPEFQEVSFMFISSVRTIRALWMIIPNFHVALSVANVIVISRVSVRTQFSRFIFHGHSRSPIVILFYPARFILDARKVGLPDLCQHTSLWNTRPALNALPTPFWPSACFWRFEVRVLIKELANQRR